MRYGPKRYREDEKYYRYFLKISSGVRIGFSFGDGYLEEKEMHWSYFGVYEILGEK